MEIKTTTCMCDLLPDTAKQPKTERLQAKLEQQANMDGSAFKQALSTIKELNTGKESGAIILQDNSRVNEQELFSAVILQSMESLGNTYLDKFKAAYKKAVDSLANLDTEHISLRAGRRSLRALVKDGTLPQKVARSIRQIALGKSQLDDNAAAVETKKKDPESRDTPLRSVSTAFTKYVENVRASVAEHQAFKKFVAREVRINGSSTD